MAFAGMFGAKEKKQTPRQAARAWDRQLSRQMRKIDRDINSIHMLTYFTTVTTVIQPVSLHFLACDRGPKRREKDSNANKKGASN